MSYPPLYILRHGETEWNADGRLQGRFDSALTAVGRAQAMRQRTILSKLDLAGFEAISSPQGRAYHTAELALDGQIVPIQIDERLSEIGLGDWAGCERRQLISEHGLRNGFEIYEHAPGGEGFEQLRNRCAAFLSERSGPAVIVTHGMTSRMLRLILLGLGTENLTELPGGQGVVYQMLAGEQTLLSERA